MHHPHVRYAAACAAVLGFCVAPTLAAPEQRTTEWTGRPTSVSGQIVYTPEGGDWFGTWPDPNDNNAPGVSPWSNGLPINGASNYDYTAIIGADMGLPPTGLHTVNVWSSSTYPSQSDLITFTNLRMGTDYVLNMSARGRGFANEMVPERKITLTGTGAAAIDNGRIDINAYNAVDGSFGSTLRLATNSVLGGRGTVRLGGVFDLSNSFASTTGGVVGSSIAGTPATRGFINDTGHTIAGFGRVEAIRENRGTIIADAPAVGANRPNLFVQFTPLGTPSVQGVVVNSGTLLADNGGTLALGGFGALTDVRNDGTFRAHGGGLASVLISGASSFINNGIVEADGAGSRVLLMRSTAPNTTGTYQFQTGHKPRALNGGTIEARGWSLRPEDVDFFGPGNTFAIGDAGTFNNAGQSYTVPATLTVELGDGGTLSGGTFDNTNGGGQIIVPAGATGKVENATVNGTVTIETGGTLAVVGTVGGSFTAGGNLSVTNGGILSPGNSPGTVHVTGDLTVAAGGGWRIELGQGAAGDLVDITGKLDLTAIGDTLTLVGGEVGQTYRIATFGSIEGAFDAFAGPASYESSVVGNDLFVSVVPEPASLGLLALGALLLGRRR